MSEPLSLFRSPLNPAGPATAGTAGPLYQFLAAEQRRQEAHLAQLVHDRDSVTPPPLPRPGQLPRVRDRLVRAHEQRDPSDFPLPDRDPATVRSAVLSATRAAELYYVAPGMATLVSAAASTLPEVHLGRSLWPADCGLMFIAERIDIETTGHSLGHDPVRLIGWGPGGDGLIVTTYGWCEDVAHVLAGHIRANHPERARLGAGDAAEYRTALRSVLDGLGAFPALGVSTLPLDEPVTGDSPGAQLARWLSTAWLLMAQPLLSESTVADRDPAVGRAYRKAKRAVPDVTIIDLRRVRHPGETGEPTEREYTRRWIVRGHWRQQAYGTGHALRRPVWIAPYIKGPEDAPLVGAERVNVWRR